MARRRRPMSAATKAKIAASQRGNKNAYKGGPKTKIKQNKGYSKRRAAGVAALGAAAVLSAPTGVGGLAAAYAAGKVHRKGVAKRNALTTRSTLLKTNRRGDKVKKAYVPHQPRPAAKRKKR